MKKSVTIFAGVIAVSTMMMGCASTVTSRIRDNHELFESFPPDVQENIQAGAVAPGYTEDMVHMALGKPHRKLSRKTPDAVEEVWIYTAAGRRFSLGVGGATGGRGTTLGTGVGIHTGGQREEAMRVIFRDGEVYAIEQQKRD